MTMWILLYHFTIQTTSNSVGKLGRSFIKVMLKDTHILAPLSAGILRFSLFIAFEAKVLDYLLRYANRIRNGTFTIPISKDASGPDKFFVPRNEGIRSLNCKVYRCSSAEAGNNTLHGGFKGYDRRVWKLQNALPNSATFVLLDPAGTEGFPGTVSTTVSYLFSDSSKFIL